MAEPNLAFGRRVERAVTERGWVKNTDVERAIPTMSRETIRKMRAGYVPRAVYVQIFATAIGEDINEWMIAAGYRTGEGEATPDPDHSLPLIVPRGRVEDEGAGTPETTQEAGPEEPAPEGLPEPTREIDLDALAATAAGYTNGEMSEESRAELAEIARLLIERDRAAAAAQLRIDALRRAAKRPRPDGE